MDELTPDQIAAAEELSEEMRKAAPTLAQIRKDGAAFFQAMMNAPEWTIAEAPKPGDVQQQQTWNIGAPTVRYFDAAGNEVPKL